MVLMCQLTNAAKNYFQYQCIYWIWIYRCYMARHDIYVRVVLKWCQASYSCCFHYYAHWQVQQDHKNDGPVIIYKLPKYLFCFKILNISHFWHTLYHNIFHRGHFQEDLCGLFIYIFQGFFTGIGAIIKLSWYHLTHLPLFSPIRRQAIIQNNAGLLSIAHLGKNFCEILIKTQFFHWWRCISKGRLWNSILSRGRWVK